MRSGRYSYSADSYRSARHRHADSYDSYDSYDGASSYADDVPPRSEARDYFAVLEVPMVRLESEACPAFTAAIGTLCNCHPSNVRILDVLEPGMIRFALADNQPVPSFSAQELGAAMASVGYPCGVLHPIRAVQSVPAGESHIVQRMVSDLSRAEGEINQLQPRLRREADARRYLERESDAIALRLSATEDRARAAEAQASALAEAVKLRDRRIAALQSGELQNVPSDARAARMLATLRHEDEVFASKDRIIHDLQAKITQHADTIVHLQGVTARHASEMAAANAQASRLDALVAEKERVAFGLRSQLEAVDVDRGADVARLEADAAERAADAHRREAAATAAERDELARVADDAAARARAAEARTGRLAGEVDRLGGDLARAEQELAAERSKRLAADARVDALEALRGEQRRTVGMTSDALREKDSTIALLEDRVAHAAAQASTLAGDVAQREARIRSLESVVHEYRSAADAVGDSIRLKDREVAAMRRAVERHVAANEALEAERDRLEAIAREARRQAASAVHTASGPGSLGVPAVQRLAAALDDVYVTAQRAGAGGPPPMAVSASQMLSDGADVSSVVESMAPQIRFVNDVLKGVLEGADQTRNVAAQSEKKASELEMALHRAETAARRAAPLGAGLQAAEARIRDLEEALERGKVDASVVEEEASAARRGQQDAEGVLRQRERLLDQLAMMLRTTCRRHALLGTMTDSEVDALGVRDLLSTILTHVDTSTSPVSAPERARGGAGVRGIAAGPRLEHGDRLHRILVDIAGQLIPRPPNTPPYSELGAVGLANLMDDASTQLRNLLQAETRHANRVVELEQRLASDDYHKTMRNVNHPQLDWMLTSRPRLVRGLWALYNDLKSAASPANLALVQHRVGPQGTEVMGHVEAARARAHALVCSYITESEKMQVGIPKALFPPVDSNTAAPPTLTDESRGATAQRLHTDRVRRAQLSGVMDPSDAEVHVKGVASGRGSAAIVTPAAARRIAVAASGPKALSAGRSMKALEAPPAVYAHPGEAFGLASVDASVDEGSDIGCVCYEMYVSVDCV